MNVKADIFEGMQYAVRFPEHYNEGMQYPILLFLHGAGTRGNDINNILTHSFLRRPEKWQDFKFIIVAPLCHKNTWFDHFETLERFALFVANQAYTDKNRIYLTGNSMGGYGTWQLAMSMPELFAAIAPLCGGGMYWNAGRLANVPVWAFHGARDKSVFVEESVKMVNAVNKRGGNARLTIYPENGHNCWTDTYGNPALYEWFLTHTNSNAQALIDEYNNSKDFG
ncbi:MAG: prolyl oligopeptidase family serine peptidase [Clostridia bacterium]|nr:prolyl oligopeptidase family serine peptidase [Clostridia bacterium]